MYAPVTRRYIDSVCLQMPIWYHLHEMAHNLSRSRLFRDFVCSAQGNHPSWSKLLPFDPAYWKSASSGASIMSECLGLEVPIVFVDQRLSSESLTMLMKNLQLQCEGLVSCKNANLEILTQNTFYQLSYIRATETHFRHNFKHAHTLLIEWIFPVFSFFHDYIETAIAHGNNQRVTEYSMPEVHVLVLDGVTLGQCSWRHC